MNHIDELKALSPETLCCAISNIAHMVKSTSRHKGNPLWSVVGHAFAVGSTSAQELCIKAGLDPNHVVTPKMGFSMKGAR